MYQELSFISYYFQWGNSEVMKLDHASRRRWCQEISEIHKRINPSKQEHEKSILDMQPTRR